MSAAALRCSWCGRTWGVLAAGESYSDGVCERDWPALLAEAGLPARRYPGRMREDSGSESGGGVEGHAVLRDGERRTCEDPQGARTEQRRALGRPQAGIKPGPPLSEPLDRAAELAQRGDAA